MPLSTIIWQCTTSPSLTGCFWLLIKRVRKSSLCLGRMIYPPNHSAIIRTLSLLAMGTPYPLVPASTFLTCLGSKISHLCLHKQEINIFRGGASGRNDQLQLIMFECSLYQANGRVINSSTIYTNKLNGLHRKIGVHDTTPTLSTHDPPWWVFLKINPSWRKYLDYLNQY